MASRKRNKREIKHYLKGTDIEIQVTGEVANGVDVFFRHNGVAYVLPKGLLDERETPREEPGDGSFEISLRGDNTFIYKRINGKWYANGSATALTWDSLLLMDTEPLEFG